MWLCHPALQRRAFIDRSMLMACCCSMLACGWNPLTDDPDPDPIMYYQNPDSAWKVLANLQYSYRTRDVDLYSECFSEDFEFFMPEEFWADYDGDGLLDSCWGVDVELAITEAMFESVDLVELSLVGSSESLWSGDSTGTTWQLSRGFNLVIYPSLVPADSLSAYGMQEFLLRPDSAGIFHIWKWWDYSDPAAPFCWTELKGIGSWSR